MGKLKKAVKILGTGVAIVVCPGSIPAIVMIVSIQALQKMRTNRLKKKTKK
jgi:hypothetical protein